MNIWRSLEGFWEVELTSAEPERELAMLSAWGLELSRVTPVDDLTFRFWIRRNAFQKAAALCEKRGAELKKVRKLGIFWRITGMHRRPVLTFGICFLLAATLWLPKRIFFLRVEGNEQLPAKAILAAAENCGISFGANRRAVRSEKMKNALLQELPQLQWAGVNTAGCVAVISVRERSQPPEAEEKIQVSSLVAASDGYILSALATGGNLLVKPGEAVEKGQLLISGYTDCGICIRATRAEGEIIAQTSRQIRAISPDSREQKRPDGGIFRKVSLLLGKKRINLWKDSGILDTTCGRMYEEYYITLPGGFVLPVALGVDTYQGYSLEPREQSPEEAREDLDGFARSYLTGQMVAGQIQQGTGTLRREDGCYLWEGSYLCQESIGREQIGDIDGKTD